MQTSGIFSCLIAISVLLSSCDAKVTTRKNCGDGFLDPGEECDKDQFQAANCFELGYYDQTGSLQCNSDCTLDLSVCVGRCQDGIIQEQFGEQCEGEDLQDMSCQLLGLGGGTLGCKSSCKYDASGCELAAVCGDGVILSPFEHCEGSDLNGQTCEGLGYHGGALACTLDCLFDLEPCRTHGRCGDGTLQELYGEQCEGVFLNDQTCETLGYYGGTLLCGSDCHFDTSSCDAVGRCGDALIQASFDETCDGENLDQQTCETLGYHAGILACQDCSFSLDGCGGRCGDGSIQPLFEQCEGANLGGQNCITTGHVFSGSLSCGDTCQFDFGACRRVIGLSSGMYHTCALLSDSTVGCWGNNGSGQLGLGDTIHRKVPTIVPMLTGVAGITLGEYFSCALLASGGVRCWGDNTHGQLGDGTTQQKNTPATVLELADATQLEAGGNHACVVLNDGSVKCWGYNCYGQVGDGTNVNRSQPVSVLNLSGVASLAGGQLHMCAVKTGGTAACWGYNDFGQLGDGTYVTFRSTPVEVTGLTSITQMTGGRYHTCALFSTGTASCWGSRNLGNGQSSGSSTPVAVSGLTGILQIAAGDWFTCAQMQDGALKCWGENTYGQLGDGTTTERLLPVAANARSSSHSAPGNQHACVIVDNGRHVQCTGNNGYGQLGTGNNDSSNIYMDITTP